LHIAPISDTFGAPQVLARGEISRLLLHRTSLHSIACTVSPGCMSSTGVRGLLGQRSSRMWGNDCPESWQSTVVAMASDQGTRKVRLLRVRGAVRLAQEEHARMIGLASGSGTRASRVKWEKVDPGVNATSSGLLFTAWPSDVAEGRRASPYQCRVSSTR